MQWGVSSSPISNKASVTKLKYKHTYFFFGTMAFFYCEFIKQRQSVNQVSYVDVLPVIWANLCLRITEFRLRNLFLQHDYTLVYRTFSAKSFRAI